MTSNSKLIRSYLLTSVCLLILNGQCFCQKTSQPNCFYMEAGGNGFLGSLNYERQILKVSGLAARIGVGFTADYLDTTLQFHFPPVVGFDYFIILDSAKSYLDVGFGITWLTKISLALNKKYNNPDNIYESYVLSCGYRRIFRNDMMFRISLLFVNIEVGAGPWIGISLGKSF